MSTTVTKGEPLNILHTIDLNKLYPIVRCQLLLDQPLQIERLKSALVTVGRVIPELFAGYDLQTNEWRIPKLDPDQLIHPLSETINVDALKIDLEAGPQLHIYLQDTETHGQKVTFVISHILTDGAGFKQFLYLLADVYNRGPIASENIQNHMDIEGLKQRLAHRPTRTIKPSDHPAKPLYLPKLASPTTDKTYCAKTRTLTKVETQALKTWSKNHGVTLNDIFMATYGQLMQSYADVPEITLACPTDMRQYLPDAMQHQLRIQNSTARYNLALANDWTQPLPQTIQAVHAQMAHLKKEQQYLQSVEQLVQLAESASITELRKVVQQNYSVRPIAYTNFGIIDAQRLKFDGCKIQKCIFTGSFRIAPAFQVAFSTFDDRLLFGFNMIGTAAEIRFGNTILQQLYHDLKLVSLS